MDVETLILFDGATLFLILVWMLKLLAICNAIRWLYSNGASYGKRLTDSPPVLPDDYYTAFKECNGKFLPFGVKDFRLRQFIGKAKGNKALIYGARFFQRWLFRFNKLTLVTTLYLFVSASITI